MEVEEADSIILIKEEVVEKKRELQIRPQVFSHSIERSVAPLIADSKIL